MLLRNSEGRALPKARPVTLYRPSKDEIRARLSLPYVCAHLGIMLDGNDESLCPFHADTRPSFHLFEGDDGVQRWSCMPCGVTGSDVFDLLQRKLNLDFSEALEHATGLFQSLPADYEPQRVQVKRGDPSDWAADVEQARARAAEKDAHGILSMLTGLASAENPAEAARWDTFLRSQLGWGIADEGVYMPHWSPDGQLTGCKIRKGNGERISKTGSRYDNLYASWLGTRHRDALLTEGETDCAWAMFQAAELGLPLNVYALPRGASNDPAAALQAITADFMTFLSKLRGTIYLAFDPDTAGVTATRAWIAALDTAGFGDRVRVCSLPLHRDLREARPDLRRLLEQAKRPLAPPDNILEAAGGYVRQDRQGNGYVAANWSAEPTAVLSGGDDPGYEVALNSRGTQGSAVLRLSDLESTRALNRWANRHNLMFTGSDGDRTAIAKYIECRAAVVPEIFQTERVGMHEAPEAYAESGPTCVFPAGWHGKTPWRYAPTAKSADVSQNVLLPDRGTLNWRWLSAFLALNDTSVTHPLLAWLVAAARRNEIQRFPLLFISGSSGVGKSTIAELALKMLGSTIRADLGAVTPFVLLRTLACSSTLPVFVDEYTRLSRRDTREAFQGAIPALYTGDYAERGQADLSSMRYKMSAPTIVAGEDTFALDREMERVVAVHPRRAGQNHAALEYIASAPLQYFGDLLHFWLAERPGDLPELATHANTRPEYNRNVLLGGWQTLLQLLDYAASMNELPPTLPSVPDLSALEHESHADEENIYVTALKEGFPLRDTGGLPVVWTDESGRGTWVRARALIKSLERGSDIQLPGGERALRAYFEERYGNSEHARIRPPMAVTSVWAHLLPGLLIEQEDEAL